MARNLGGPQQQQRGHSLVVRTPRRGRGNPGSIPGDRFSGGGGSERLLTAVLPTYVVLQAKEKDATVSLFYFPHT